MEKAAPQDLFLSRSENAGKRLRGICVKPFFQKVMHGTFTFADLADVTAENIKTQVDTLIDDASVISDVI